MPPADATAPKTSAAAVVKVGGAPADKSIAITGSRTTVSGKPGIKIDSVVTGIDNGNTIIPCFRFPGETSFSEGSARPVISDGSFTWQRKTGKKFYAYVTSDDSATKSKRASSRPTEVGQRLKCAGIQMARERKLPGPPVYRGSPRQEHRT